MSHLGPGQVQQIGSVTLVLAERNLTERSVPVFCVGIFWNTTGLKKEERQNYYSDDAKGKLVIKKTTNSFSNFTHSWIGVRFRGAQTFLRWRR